YKRKKEEKKLAGQDGPARGRSVQPTEDQNGKQQGIAVGEPNGRPYKKAVETTDPPAGGGRVIFPDGGKSGGSAGGPVRGEGGYQGPAKTVEEAGVADKKKKRAANATRTEAKSEGEITPGLAKRKRID